MFDRLVAATTGTAGAESAEAWTRVESAACARRLSAMVTVLDTAYATSGSADREQWCIDNWSAVCDHIGATQARTSGQISSMLLVGTALRDRFPKVQALFAAGRIDYRTARTVVMRCLLVQSTRALHALDAALARALGTREPMSQERLENAIDGHVASLDPDAVRRTQTRARSRNLDITYDEEGGMAEVIGTLFAHDAHSLDTRLNAMAATVCPADPRTKGQLRADASGALGRDQDRLACLCDTADCTAAQNPPSTGVVIHLVVHEDTLTPPGDHGPGDGPPPPDGPCPNDPNNPDAEPTAVTDSAGSDGATSECEPSVAEQVAAECAGLDGHHPRQLPKPVSKMTLTELFTACEHRPAHLSALPPAMLLGGRVLPGAIAHRAAQHATMNRSSTLDTRHPNPTTVPHANWSPSSALGIKRAAIPAATPRPPTATSTTPSPGPTGPRRPPTSNAYAVDTIC